MRFIPVILLFAALQCLQASEVDSISAMEKAVFEQVNQFRETKNLKPLTMDSKISRECRKHSEAMASKERPLGHDEFDERIKLIKIPYSEVAENVASNRGSRDPIAKAVQSWIESTGHRENMLGEYSLTGVGVAQNERGQYFFTQIFIQPSEK
jgi:uncharacterized protein YkwD